MKNMAIELGVNEADIIVEDTSNSTIENFENVLKILKHLKEIDNLDRLILISSEFHMKRCREIAKKIFPPHIEYTLAPAKDGFSDKENWFLSEYKRDSGRFYVYWEGKILIENAQKGTIENIEV